MALNPDALTTVDKAELWLDRTGGTGLAEQNDYAFMEMIINGISTTIARYTGREFVPGETAATKRFRYNGGGYLSLEPYELRTLTSITLYTDMPTTAQVALGAQSGTAQSDYRLEPRQKTILGTYLWIAMPRFTAYTPAYVGPAMIDSATTEREVTIVGDWGVGYVPADVEMATWIAVAHVYDNPAGFSRSALGAADFQEEAETDAFVLPRASRALLAPYRRP